MKSRMLLAASATALLSACAFPVNEHYFFVPRAIAQKATSPDQMRLGNQEMVTGPFADDSYLKGRSPLLAGLLPAKVTHDFVTVAGQRIAVSRITSAKSTGAEPLIVVCGGNASDRITSGVRYIDKVLPWGEVLLFDYPGYGDSDGAATMKFMTPFQQAFPAYLDTLPKGRPLVFWGHSLGGLVCSELAKTSRQVDAVVLETTSPSSASLAETRKPGFVPFLTLALSEGLRDYNIPAALSAFNGPILVLGAGKDQVIPVKEARTLGEQLKAEGRHAEYHEYPNADHFTAPLNSDFARDATAFFRSVTDQNH